MLMSIFSASVLMESLMNLMLASSTLMKTMAAIWRRMMMTSGGGVKYKGSMDCFIQVMKNE